jgi:D-tyrosyl-tRNA(Tyr) deacylase
MRAVIQRVKSCSVSVDNKLVSKIDRGILVLLGVSINDGPADAEFLADKISNLRIFEDENGKMNLSLVNVNGEIMVVSQFTLYGDCKKGRRPSFIDAAPPEKASELYEYFALLLKKKNIPTQTGEFRAMMDVALVNDGPVTLIVESKST